mgnify:CR=1 FL=1
MSSLDIMIRKRRLKARFLKDPRYAEAAGKTYPVLLTSFKKDENYLEFMLDPKDYPADWRLRFFSELKRLDSAILASDSNLDGDWRFLAIYEISDVQLNNFLSCRFGRLRTRLSVEELEDDED